MRICLLIIVALLFIPISFSSTPVQTEAGVEADCMTQLFYFAEQVHHLDMESNYWWKSLSKRLEIPTAQSDVALETSDLQQKFKPLQPKFISKSLRQKIDDLIDASSTSLDLKISHKRRLKEYGLSLASGSSGEVPQDPIKLRAYRQKASSYANSAAPPSINEQFIKVIHSILTSGKKRPSTYRNFQAVTGHVDKNGRRRQFLYMPTHLVESAMRDFQQQLKKAVEYDLDPINTAIWIERALVSIHPFSDANGRVSREVSAAFLRHHGIPRPLFLENEEYSFAVFNQQGHTPLSHNEIREIYIGGIQRHISLLE